VFQFVIEVVEFISERLFVSFWHIQIVIGFYVSDNVATDIGIGGDLLNAKF
jgi:hypothetical protein